MEPNYLTVVEDAKTELTRLLDSQEGWTLVKTYGQEKELVIESRPSTTHNCNIYRTIVKIKASPSVVDDTLPLCPFNKYKEWAEDVKDVKLIENLPNEAIIYQTITNKIAKVISSRSFISVGKREANDETFFRYGVGIDYHKPLEEEGMVRGTYGPCGYRIKPDPNNPKNTICEMVMQVDFAGSVPKRVINGCMGSTITSNHEMYITYMKKKGYLNE